VRRGRLLPDHRNQSGHDLLHNAPRFLPDDILAAVPLLPPPLWPAPASHLPPYRPSLYTNPNLLRRVLPLPAQMHPPRNLRLVRRPHVQFRPLLPQNGLLHVNLSHLQMIIKSYLLVLICKTTMARIYNQFLERYPIPTKCLTSGALFSIGDALTQFSILWVICSLRKERIFQLETQC
jgi:hypothetical protein